MKNKLFRTIEKFLYNQKELEQAIRLEKKAIAESYNSRKEDNVGGGKSNSISDPTSRIAILLSTPLRSVVVKNLGTVYKPETWVEIMEAAYKAQSPLQQKVLRARYYNQTAKPIAISIDFHIGESTVYDWCKFFVWEVVARAAAAGLIRFDN